jgi:hypothetical protein
VAITADVVRTIADMGPAAVWLGAGVLGTMAVFVGYIGVALAAALKARDQQERDYRARLLKDLLETIRDTVRGRGAR